jgi:hypothetical protein
MSQNQAMNAGPAQPARAVVSPPVRPGLILNEPIDGQWSIEVDASGD